MKDVWCELNIKNYPIRVMSKENYSCFDCNQSENAFEIIAKVKFNSFLRNRMQVRGFKPATSR